MIHDMFYEFKIYAIDQQDPFSIEYDVTECYVIVVI